MRSIGVLFTERVRPHMAPPPPAVSPGERCERVLALMAEQEASSAVVVDGEGAPVGIVSEQDVCRRVAFRLGPEAPIERAMSAPVRVVEEGDYLYRAISRMRRRDLRHLPVVDAGGRLVGMLHLHEALAAATARSMRLIDALTVEPTLEGLRAAKQAQVPVARALIEDAVPAVDIQRLLAELNRDIYRRVVRAATLRLQARGLQPPPVELDVIVMGSGGREESLLNPDQDNGFILEDYPDEEHARVDAWFIALAEAMTADLAAVGFPLCRGHVMATNPVWRKTLSQWELQLERWAARASPLMLRLCDIFFDFRTVAGSGTLGQALRERVTALAANRALLREMYHVDEEHGVALGWFGRLRTDPLPGPNRGKINLKHTGTLPLVGAVRLMALAHRVPETGTLARLDALRAQGHLDKDEHDYLAGAFRLLAELLLRQQLADIEQGRPPGHHVPPEALTEREKDMLTDAFRAIESFRHRVRDEVGASWL